MMKRWLSILCVLALLLSLSGCPFNMGPDVNVLPGTTAGTVPSPGAPTTGTTQTVPSATESTPVPTESTPVPTESTPVPTESTPVPTQSVPIPTESTPVPTQCAHNYVLSSSLPATCTEAGSETYTCSKCGHFYGKTLNVKPHTVVTDIAVAATCTAAGKTEGQHCSACGLVIVPQATVPVTAHREVVIPGKPATELESGLSDGKKCSVCGTVLVQQTVIPGYLDSCSGDFGYRNLASQDKGTAKQTMYTRMDALAKAFHLGTDNVSDGAAFHVNYADLGLNEDDAIQVWMGYRNDHPLYYWISGTVSFTDQYITVTVENDYASGAVRQSYNRLITQKIGEYMAKTAGETSAYQFALAYHDAIIQEIDYAIGSDKLPEKAAWAHNILGVFEKGKGVCESYARTFQLLLNVSGVENIFVSGIGGKSGNQEDHAWNLVKLEDGKWYWYDLTWDDTPKSEWGIYYGYFCVNDTQAVNWQDCWDPQPPTSFMQDHIPGTSFTNPEKLSWQISLPARADTPFQSSTEPLLRSTFTVGGLTYSVCGYRTVQLVKVAFIGPLNIPETVTYRGDTYTVISIGGLREGTSLYDTFSILAENTTVSIPKTVKFIWDMALAGYAVTEYAVDSANPWFTAKDGVLYTKNLYTLIAYPRNAPKIDRFVIPEQTHWVANNAFDGMRNPFHELVLSKDLEDFGYANWATGYLDAPVVSENGGIAFGGNVIGGQLGSLVRWCNGMNSRLVITVPEGCANFAEKDGIIYRVNGITGFKYYRALAASDTDIVHAVLQEGAISLEMTALCGCKNLQSVTLPVTVTTLDSGCFGHDDWENPSLKEIKYGGTMEQWNAISKPQYLVKPKVICTDGTISANAW